VVVWVVVVVVPPVGATGDSGDALVVVSSVVVVVFDAVGIESSPVPAQPASAREATEKRTKHFMKR